MKRITTALAALAIATGTTAAVAGPAEAGPNQFQDGLVNVAVGDVNILNDVSIGIAANVIANVCGVKVGPVAVLGTAVDRSGDTATVCEGETGPVTISQA